MMETEALTLRRGLGNWDKVQDPAMGSGLQSSMDTPAAESFNKTEQSGTTEFLAHRMRLNPREEEAQVIEKLNDQIDTFFARSYGDIDQSVDKFFAKFDEANRLEPIELERLILDLQKATYTATSMVASLYQDAYLADRVQQDEYWDAYRAGPDKIKVSGKITIGDRQAYAYDQSRDSRFYYYYVFLLWRRLSEKLGSLKDLQRTLEFQRNRTQKDAKGSWG